MFTNKNRTTFAKAITTSSVRTVRTENNMKAKNKTGNACVDLFFKIGASRGKDITSGFTDAYRENKDVALRILQWARDVREGAGERELFRQVLRAMESTAPKAVLAILPKIPELGRWDDLLIFTNPTVKVVAFTMIGSALDKGNGLCAKWMPRKGPLAVELRQFFGLSPKQYRKGLVELTKVVETQMCENNWDEINFNMYLL